MPSKSSLMKAMLNPEQVPLMGDSQAKEKRAGGKRGEGRRAREAATSAHFLLKIHFKVSPARLPQGTPQFPRLCRERERCARGGEGNGQEEEACGGLGRGTGREAMAPECSVDPTECWAQRGHQGDRDGTKERGRTTTGKHWWFRPGQRVSS